MKRTILICPAVWYGVVFLCCVSGCGRGGGASAPLSQAEGVEAFIQSLDDVRERPQTLATYFAQGSTPGSDQLKRYAQYTYDPASKPTLRGSEATLKVKILDAQNQEVGNLEWIVVKDGTDWKLKSAPLP